MRTNHLAPSLIAALVLAGCAAAAPGYEPVSKANMKRLEAEAKAPPPSGGMTAQGTYVLTDQEKGYDCRKLSSLVQIGILRLREVDKRPQKSAFNDVGRQVHSILSPKQKFEGTANPVEERARIEAYNKALAEKRCRTFDIEAGIKAPVRAPVPAPVIPDPKKK